MMYKKVVVSGYILGVGEVERNGIITEEEYNAITALFADIPTPPEGYESKLNANTLQWDFVEMQSEGE